MRWSRKVRKKMVNCVDAAQQHISCSCVMDLTANDVGL